MKKSRFTGTQIIAMSKQVQGGIAGPEVCRKQHPLGDVLQVTRRVRRHGRVTDVAARGAADRNWRLKKMYTEAQLLKASNGGAESINGRIQLVKHRRRGFRNKQRFRNAIYFHLGGLDLYPEALKT